VDGETGILVREASPDAFADAVDRAARAAFPADVVRANALRFSRERFMREFQTAVDETVWGSRE
jgi:hypothetical protein